MIGSPQIGLRVDRKKDRFWSDFPLGLHGREPREKNL
jgi:hypothetical protein